MHGLAACVNKELLLHGIISWKPCGFLLMFFVSFTSLSVFLLFSLSVAVFNSNSSNTDEVFSINPSANVFVFGNFGSHHKDWLTFLMELIDLVNPVIIFLSQMTLVRWLTFLLESLTVTLIIVLLFCIYLFHMMLVFVLQRFSLHWEILIMWKQDALFQCIGYDNSRTDWDDLHDHLRDVPWEDIFKLNASVAASEFCEWAQVRIDLYIIVHRNHFLSFVPTE